VKAVFIRDYGSVDNLVVGDAPEPKCGERDVLVRVEYAGLRWGDVMARNGWPSRARATPFVAGQEATGVVVAVGSEVRGWRVGDRVMATPAGGAFAELLAVRPNQLLEVPDHVPLATMLAYPVNLRTAYYMVYVWAKVQEGERVLLHAAAGGVGQLALQILKRRFGSVSVVAIASGEEKLQRLREEGADHVVDRTRQDYVQEIVKIWGPKASGFATGGERRGGVDVAFNGVSGATLDTDWQVIRKRGRWVIYGYAAGRGRLDTSGFGYDGITIMPFSSIAWAGTPEHQAGSRFIDDWLGSERLVAPVVHDLADVQAVQREFEQGRTIGKQVFRVA
jgi:NADPH2:quinone reductase